MGAELLPSIVSSSPFGRNWDPTGVGLKHQWLKHAHLVCTPTSFLLSINPIVASSVSCASSLNKILTYIRNELTLCGSWTAHKNEAWIAWILYCFAMKKNFLLFWFSRCFFSPYSARVIMDEVTKHAWGMIAHQTNPSVVRTVEPQNIQDVIALSERICGPACWDPHDPVVQPNPNGMLNHVVFFSFISFFSCLYIGNNVELQFFQTDYSFFCQIFAKHFFY